MNKIVIWARRENYFEAFSAPQQSLVQKWLRERHNKHFIISRYPDNKWFWSKNMHSAIFSGYFLYEEALENALFHNLKSLIDV